MLQKHVEQRTSTVVLREFLYASSVELISKTTFFLIRGSRNEASVFT
jgi:hypothetical protein